MLCCVPRLRRWSGAQWSRPCLAGNVGGKILRGLPGLRQGKSQRSGGCVQWVVRAKKQGRGSRKADHLLAEAKLVGCDRGPVGRRTSADVKVRRRWSRSPDLGGGMFYSGLKTGKSIRGDQIQMLKPRNGSPKVGDFNETRRPVYNGPDE